MHGFREKLDAARTLGIKVVLVRRIPETGYNIKDIMGMLERKEHH